MLVELFSYFTQKPPLIYTYKFQIQILTAILAAYKVCRRNTNHFSSNFEAGHKTRRVIEKQKVRNKTVDLKTVKTAQYSAIVYHWVRGEFGKRTTWF